MQGQTDTQYDRLHAEAYEAGAAHGRSAASWYFDGNTTEDEYRRVLVGLEDGDPAVYDTFPASPLSGEWSGDPLPADVLADLGVEPDDDAADDYLAAYEDGFGVAVADAIEAAARSHVFNVEPYAWPGGYPMGYLMDDGEYLCARCVNDPTNPLHLSGSADGWKWVGTAVLDGSAVDYDGPISCGHCGAVLVEDDRTPSTYASEAAGCFHTEKRDDGSHFTKLREWAPQWVRDLVYDAHAGMLPDDWKYDCIRAALEAIAETDDYDYDGLRFANEYADVYDADLLAWVGSHSYRTGYVDEARAEWGSDDATHSEWLQRGQINEASEVYAACLDACEAQLEGGR